MSSTQKAADELRDQWGDVRRNKYVLCPFALAGIENLAATPRPGPGRNVDLRRPLLGYGTAHGVGLTP